MVTNSEIEMILERALREKGDFAELFFEDTQEMQIMADEGIVQGRKTVYAGGAGLYLLDGLQSIYVYSNDMSLEGLLRLADMACELMGEKKNTAEMSTAEGLCHGAALRTSNWTSPKLYDETKHMKGMIQVLREADLALREPKYQVVNLGLQYFFSDRRIQVANSEGLFTNDQRATTRLRYRLTTGDGRSQSSKWNDIYKQGGFDTFLEKDEHILFGRELAVKLNASRSARRMEPCCVPLVLEAGAGATLFHECVGHMVEGNSILQADNPYKDMLGKRVASDKVTLYDDATYPGALATCKIDDEGMESRKIPLIENGILKNFMLDRRSARALQMERNGCGRRQNYMFAPASRMSNTYLQPGSDDEDEMIRDIDKGLYVCSIGGGMEGAQFSIALEDAYWIENGEITYPVKNINLTGNGIEIMQKIDRVGTKLGPFDGGFCGAVSGIVPTTTNQPRIRIKDVNLG